MLKNKKGFTLVELMVVVVIICILVLVALPIYTDVQRQAKEAAHDQNNRVLTSAATIYLAKHAPLTRSVKWPDEDSWRGLLEEWPEPVVPAGRYTVEITVDGQVTVVPGVRVYGW